MRPSLAGGVTVVLVVFAIVMLQPGSPRLGHGLLRAQSPWSAAPRWVSGADCNAAFAESRVGLLERGPPSPVSDPASDQESCCKAG